MAVQVPKLNRFEPQQTQTVGRSELQVPNIPAIVQPQMNAVTKVAEQQVQYFQKQEDNAIDTAAKDAANKYQVYLNDELSKARQFQGDPTQVYTEFDNNSVTKYNELLDSKPNLSNRGKTLLARSLDQVSTQYQMQRDTAHASQYYNYDKKVTEESAKLKAQTFTTMASYIQLDDAKPFKHTDEVIRQLGNIYKAHGEKFGAVTRDENGNQIPTDGIKLQIAAATTDAIVSSINTLNASGRADLAEAMYVQYRDLIDVTKQDDVFKSIQTRKQNIKALNAVESLKTINDPKKLDKEASKIFGDDVEGKAAFYQAMDDKTRRDENIKKRISNNFADYVVKHVLNKQNSGSPYNSISEMQNDEAVADVLSKLDAGDLKTVYQLVKSPPKSDFKAFARNMDHISNNTYVGMSGAQLNKEFTGLSQSDRNFFKGWAAKLNTETESQVRSRIGKALEDLRYGLIATKAIPLDSKGNPTKKGEAKIYRLKTQFLKSSNFITKDTPLADITTKIDDIVTKTKAKKDSSGSWWSGFTSNEEDDNGEDAIITEPTKPRSGPIYPGSGMGGQVPDKPKAGVPPIEGKTYSEKQILDARKAFKTEKGVAPKTTDELKKYMIEKGI